MHIFVVNIPKLELVLSFFREFPGFLSGILPENCNKNANVQWARKTLLPRAKRCQQEQHVHTTVFTKWSMISDVSTVHVTLPLPQSTDEE